MKKVIIIGAGISGLAAGIYARQSGFETVIYEKHFMTGGVCTSWSRKGYTFEGAVHWLTDSGKDRAFYRIWEEVGILGKGIKTYRNDPYTTLEYQGKTVSIYRDLAKLKAELMNISPQDEKAIQILCSDIKALVSMEIPIYDVKGVTVKTPMKFGIKNMLKMIPAFPKMGRIMKQSVEEYLSMFQSEGIKTVLGDLMPQDFCAMALISTMATFSNNGHFPEGGALELVERMTKKFTDLGGTICLSTPVDKVIVEHGKTTGVLISGKKVDADAVVITRDVLSADCLFDNPPTDEWIQECKEHTKSQTTTFVGVGVKADMSAMPYQLHYFLNKPLEYAGMKYNRFGFTNYAAYPNYSPQGSTSLTACLGGDTYDWWANARKEGRYTQEKEKLAEAVASALEEKFPGIQDKIEVIDIATPLTYERYTGSYRGAWMSIMPSNSKVTVSPQTCKDMEGVYYAGFRMQNPGGLPVALISGRNAAQLICKQFGTVFQGEL